MNNQKLILLYGFASSGKTTLSKKYINENPLTISIEGDQLIGMMGQWRQHEDVARELVFKHSKSIVENHLQSKHDVILPYLLTDAKHASTFEEIAKRNNAYFHEIYIDIEKDNAIKRLLERGCWGEEGSPKLAVDDMGEINDLYKVMKSAMSKRNNIISIASKAGEIEETYNAFIKALK